MKEILSVDHVSFAYPTDDEEVKRNAVDDVSFTIHDGEWIAIVGHNGSGKSTLAKLMIGLLFPDEGNIHVFLEQLTARNIWDVRSKMGIVFQNPDNQFVGSTVQDDVAFALENKGVPFEEMVTVVRESLTLVKMEDFLDHEPHHLSGGQKQRVAIAGALALKPNLLIMDEATSMLDPQGREEVIQIVSELKRTTDLTVISITHDLEEALLADRIIVMNQGKVLDIGTPEEIFSDGDKLESIGLDIPFAMNMSNLIRQNGLDLAGEHMTEEELVNELWTSHYNK
ncbi:energy-coupling factor ABC transporter ATP-binding protein [Sporosarcina pasteurii]|uniref:Energy-coupling factor transporter ATP-binding protein EcfA1 n=1 Tax=Sporosarcina pasteurii TaxID=1474 RepID=A0A380CKV3_SPOPA|nr:energy-coupling factor ABC transporter ATP-binding protein [Sporosarcina pasteurii]MDS9472032.1 energy-coupling factor ABC transporter ATP-binding protein [Sporosarcina pasteurii]QBQ06760.1 energy-coupling factor ABC transporter ATP-binding protein [Sporosarcina pasteurii]SUJ21057.1 Energy-coupling factor transporter ATP-binding protein EcfA1 [Sporosarcina pasteurii]